MAMQVQYSDISLAERAQEIAKFVSGHAIHGLSGESGIYLRLSHERLELEQGGPDSPGATYVDFLDSKIQTRVRTTFKKDPLMKAMGLPREGLRIFDLTAGMAKDSFVFFSQGAHVTAFEKNEVVFSLLEDGYRRWVASSGGSERFHIAFGDAFEILESINGKPSSEIPYQKPDVIYIDPMYPQKKSSAKPKKEMEVFRKILEPDSRVEELLERSLEVAQYRVVLKRPLKSDFAGGRKPTHSFESKLVRFDMYLLKPF